MMDNKEGVPRPNDGWPRAFIKTHGQMLFNIYLFINLAIWTVWQSWKAYSGGRLDYIEGAYAVHNLVMITMILVRRRHQAVDRNLFHQLVALIAFFSGVLFIGVPETAGPAALSVSKGVVFAANALGIVTLFNLGRSFGILIAFREIRQGGLYSVVRHPMYGTDILLRVGFLISHVSAYSVLLFTVSTAAYVYRAILEERFLVAQSGYREYMDRVRYRFIPFVY